MQAKRLDVVDADFLTFWLLFVGGRMRDDWNGGEMDRRSSRVKEKDEGR